MKWTLRQFAITGGALALFGCAVTPEYHPPAVELPARWGEGSAGAGAAVSADFPWWRSFNDAVLTSLVERALRNNSDLQLAAARVREARARGGAAASAWPSVQASASYARERESANAPSPVLVHPDGTVEPPGTAENLFQAGFDAGWEIDLFGGLKRSKEAALADVDSALYDRGAVTLTLLGEVSRSYFEYRRAQQQSRLAQEAVVAQRESVALLRSRAAAGMATGLDLARAEAQLQRNAAQLPALEGGRSKALHRLAVLLHEASATLAPELAVERPLPLPTREFPVGLPSDLLRQRPDIRSAERKVAAASARLGAATTDLYPKFSLLGRAGLASAAAEDFFNGGSGYWSVGPSISWPIFQGGRIKGNIEVRDAQLQQALISYRRAILLAIEDVENCLSGYREDRERRAALLAAVAAEQRSADLAGERYAGGLGDYREVLDAQRSLFELRGELVSSEIALLLGQVALYKAVGGGWQVPLAAEQGPVPRDQGEER